MKLLTVFGLASNTSLAAASASAVADPAEAPKPVAAVSPLLTLEGHELGV